MRSFWNPFTTYCVACAFVVLVYSLDFSSLYPDLTQDVVAFLIYSVLSAGLLSFFVAGIPIPEIRIADRKTWECLLACFFVVGYASEFAYAGDVPLLQALSGGGADYTYFGIPTFHVLLWGISSFYSVFWWDCYLGTKYKRYLIFSSIGIVAPMLMFSRGGVLMNALACLFVYGNRRGLRRRGLLLGVCAICVALGFGYLGELRVGTRAQNLILTIGGANEKILDSQLPDPTFWFYLYVSSPLANLQYAELHRSSDALSRVGVVVDFLPDFVSKYFATVEEVSAVDRSLRISDALTAGTAYARPLVNLGWIGPYALHTIFLAFAFCATRFSRRSRYYGAILALLCAQGGLMFFDNMFVYAGSIGPILVGLALAFTGRLQLKGQTE
jgi:hypothetical protein